MTATVITFVAYCVIPDSMAQRAQIPGQPAPTFDWLGCITGVTGLILINFALNQAPMAGWKTPYVYFMLILGIICTAAFFYVEFYLTDQPLIPVRGLQPQAILALACIAAGWASHGIWIYYLYSFQMRVRHISPLLTTANLLPVAPLGIAFALSTNTLIKKMGVAKVMCLAMSFFLLGSLLLAVVPEHQSYWGQTFLSILIMPGGMNLSFPAATILLSNAMPREHQGKAASLVSTVLNYSIASGLGFAGSIESHINKDGTKMMEGFRGAWDLGIAFSALGLLVSFYFIWSLRKK
jgi:predicted MFS family arabinose efflux permease